MGILRRHPFGPEVPRHSANPCPVSGVRNMASERETATQGAVGPGFLRFTEAVTRRYSEDDPGARSFQTIVEPGQ
jgi:hypothetical protein